MKKILKRIGLILLILLFIALIPWLHFQIRNNFFPGKDLDISELRDEHLLLPDLIPVDDANNAYFDIEKSNHFLNDIEITKIYKDLTNGKSVDVKKINETLEANSEAVKYLNNAFKKDEYFYPYSIFNSQTHSKQSVSNKKYEPNNSLFGLSRLSYLKAYKLIQEKKYDQALHALTQFSKLIQTTTYHQNPTLTEAVMLITLKAVLSKQHTLIIENLEKFSENEKKLFIQSQKKLLKSEEIFASGMKHEYLNHKEMLYEYNKLEPYAVKLYKNLKPLLYTANYQQKQIKNCNNIKIGNTIQIIPPRSLTEGYIKGSFIENYTGKIIVASLGDNFSFYHEKKCENDKLFKESLLELINAAKNQ